MKKISAVHFFTPVSAMGALSNQRPWLNRLKVRRLFVMAFSIAMFATCPSCISGAIADSGKSFGLPKTRALAVASLGDPKVTRLVKRGDPLIAKMKKNPYHRTMMPSIYEYDIFMYRGKISDNDTMVASFWLGMMTLGTSEALMIPYATATSGTSLLKKHYFFSGYNSKDKPIYFKELDSDESEIVESGKLGNLGPANTAP